MWGPVRRARRSAGNTKRTISIPGTTKEEAQTVHDVLGFITDEKCCQALLVGHDDAPLPKAVMGEAVTGAHDVKY
ncbi:MAG TPA: hypothetical protein VNV44_07500 [Solirubrobacteraceae bacterium]|nr:hypothetical protein [Solirubrobacteraceae bacterium]